MIANTPEFMSVWTSDGLPPTAKLLALRLAAMADGEGIAIVFRNDLLRWVGCTSDEFDEALRQLLRGNIICNCRVGTMPHPNRDVDEPFVAVEVTVTQIWIPRPDIQSSDFETKDTKRARIFAKTESRCFYCIEAPAEHIDHMHPSSRGGTDADDNLVGACATCNVTKKDRTVEEYRAYLSYKRKASIAEVKFYGESEAAA